MLDFQTYRLLNETLGLSTLGIKTPQNLGLNNSFAGYGEAELPPEANDDNSGGGDGMNLMGDQPPSANGDEGESDTGEEEKDPSTMSHEELVAALVELGHEEDELETMEDEQLRDMLIAEKEQDGGEEHDNDGETDVDLDADHADDMGDSATSDHGDNLFPSKKPASPFMKAFMKKEATEKDSEDEPTFMMKKKCSCGMDNKKMVIGKCKACKENMKKENTSGYGRPKDYDSSEDAFYKSIREQLAAANVNQKFSDGLRDFKKEDLLLPPNPLEISAMNPQPGEPGYAPQGRIGDSFTAEAVSDMIKRIEKLEKK